MTPTICTECHDTLTDKEQLDLGNGLCEACDSCMCGNCYKVIPDGAIRLVWATEDIKWMCEDCFQPTDDQMNNY